MKRNFSQDEVDEIYENAGKIVSLGQFMSNVDTNDYWAVDGDDEDILDVLYRNFGEILQMAGNKIMDKIDVPKPEHENASNKRNDKLSTIREKDPEAYCEILEKIEMVFQSLDN